jgi:pimeloyl-ACP methyl ester carboxylesterase
MLAGIPHTRVERFAKSGHFIMLDDPQPFMHKLKDFLDEENPTV